MVPKDWEADFVWSNSEHVIVVDLEVRKQAEASGQRVNV